MSSYFSSTELEQIRSAVKEAEKTTSAEIVPVFLERSGFYPEAYWKSAALFILFWSFLVYIYFKFISTSWTFNLELFLLSQIVVGGVGFLLAYFWYPWQRLFIDSKNMKARIWDKAYSIFLKEEIFNTKNRTGMLLFMSFLEKEVIILGDSGINRHVTPQIWEGIIAQLISGLRHKNKTEAIIQAIYSMGNLLKQYPIEANDENELKDDLRLGDNI